MGKEDPEAHTVEGSDRRSTAQHRRILAVVNPVSGIYSHEKTIRELRERAARMDVDLEVVETRKDQDIETAIRSVQGPFDCYLAVGGDGTVVETASVAMRDGIPLAMLPRGTANAVAWHFRIPIDVGQALKVAVRGHPLQVDVGRLPDREFLIMAGLGYDAHIIEGATRSLKKRLGFLAYLYSAARQLRRRPYVFRIHLDDQPPFRLTGATAFITNTGTLIGNVRLVKQISPTDGLLDLIVVSPENFGSFFRIVFWGLLGRLNEDPRVRYYRAKRVRVECRPSAPLEVDGDVVGQNRTLQAEILPRALTLMVLSEGMSWFPWVPDRPWTSTSAFPWFRPRQKEEAPAAEAPEAEAG